MITASRNATTLQAKLPVHIRIRYIRTPVFDMTLGEVLAVSAGALFSWVIAYVLALMIVWGITQVSDLGNAEYGIAIVFGFLGPVATIWVTARRRRRRVRGYPRFRHDRLRRVLSRPESKRRVPHRWAENELRSGPLNKRTMKRALEHVAPGTVLWLNREATKIPIVPKAIETAFEPIDMSDGNVEMEGLLEFCIDARKDELEALIDENPAIRRASIKHYLWLALRLLYAVFWLSVILRGLYDLARGQLTDRSAGFLILISVIGVSVVIPLFWENRWFLLPGKLVIRASRIWTRKIKFDIISLETHSVLLDARTGFGCVRNGRIVQRLYVPDAYSWLVIAALLSTENSPTEAEIRTFLGLADTGAIDS